MVTTITTTSTAITQNAGNPSYKAAQTGERGTDAAKPVDPRRAVVLPSPDAGPGDRITLSPAAQARLLRDAAATLTAAPVTADPAGVPDRSADLAGQLRDAAARTLDALKRNQAREFTARGVEITDPDVSMSGRSVVNLRAIAPQPVTVKTGL